MATVDPHAGSAYATCPNCGFPLHQTAPSFNAVDLQHKLPAGDASSRWVHPGSSMRGQCPSCGATVNFQHGTGQTGFSR